MFTYKCSLSPLHLRFLYYRSSLPCPQFPLVYLIGRTTGISLAWGGGAIRFKRSSLLISSLLPRRLRSSPAGVRAVPWLPGVPGQASVGQTVRWCHFREEEEVAARSRSTARRCARPASRDGFSALPVTRGPVHPAALGARPPSRRAGVGDRATTAARSRRRGPSCPAGAEAAGEGRFPCGTRGSAVPRPR